MSGYALSSWSFEPRSRPTAELVPSLNLLFCRPVVRLQIIKTLSGEIDGIRLDRFLVGEAYEVGATLASYLLALGAAVPVFDGQAILTIPHQKPPRTPNRGKKNRAR